METRQFGTSDMRITPLGVGAWAMGGGNWEFGWGSQDDTQSIAAIHHALDLGVNWIDTAAVYGLGRSEQVVARALADYSGARPYIFTKCSMVWNEQRQVSHSLKADSIRRECEASLRRLNTDVIDLYQMHWPDPEPDIEEGWSEMAKLQQEGKVRHIGVSNFTVEQMKRAQALAPITSLQPPYSLIERDVESDILPYCQQQGIGVIVYSPMASGLLTGAITRKRVEQMPEDDWRKHDSSFNEPELSRNLQLVERLRAIGQRHGRSPGEVALAWALHNLAVTATIVGVRSPQQVDGVIGAGAFHLSDDEVAEIEQA